MEVDTLERPGTNSDKPIVHGDPENGFIVEHHDGETHRTHGCMAGSEDEAIDDARRKWRGDDRGEDHQAVVTDTERDDVKAEIAELRARLDAFEMRVADLEHPVGGVKDPGHAMMATPPPGTEPSSGGYPGALRPPPAAEPSLAEQLEQQRASRVAGDPAIDPEYEAFKRDRDARNKAGAEPV